MISLDIQIAHFHPILVHLPIGTILLAFVLELYSRFRPKVSGDELIGLALGVTGITALLSLGTGWFLGEEGGFDEELLFLHRWMAVAFTATAILLFFLKRTKANWSKALYLPVFIIALVLVGITGHFGGNMTHGEDYLFTDTSVPEVVITDIAQANVHADIIQPILERKCVSCHNSGKLKGGLLLTSSQEILAGGDSGSLFDTLKGEPPLLVHRMKLPLENEEHMPPKGKVQLTSDEIALVQWWVANDHCFDCKTKDLETPAHMERMLAALEEDDSPRALIAKTVDPVPLEWLNDLRNSGISVYSLAEGNPLLTVNLFGKKQGLKNDMTILREYAENIVALNLANSQFNDTLAKAILPFENITKLQLQQTHITDKSLEILKRFERLESLNLYGTKVTDAIFKVASEMPALQNLYLYETETTKVALDKFQSEYPKITVRQIPQEAFTLNILSPPNIVAETDFFKQSMKVELDAVFEDSAIYYTLNGTEPDSTSIRYNGPINIDRSTTVSAISIKKGWKPSEISSSSFKKSSFDLENVALNQAPHEKYEGQKGKTLTDLKRGSTNFVDGNWLGYEGTHFMATMRLANEGEVSTVSIGALSAPASWIFYPTGFVIRTSEDGKTFKKVKSTNLPAEKANIDVNRTFFDIEIPPTTAKFIQVEIKSQLRNPSWHSDPGGKSWVFIDEIVLN